MMTLTAEQRIDGTIRLLQALAGPPTKPPDDDYTWLRALMRDEIAGSWADLLEQHRDTVNGSGVLG